MSASVAGVSQPISGPAAGATVWLAVAGIAAAAGMDAVNATLLTVARAHVMGGLHASPDELAWINMAYLAAKLAAFPFGAWVVLRTGTREPILWSACLLLIMSVAAALTTSFELVVALRVLQGAAGAVLLVAGQSALLSMFPSRRQALVQAAFALAIIMAPTTLTPALQGWITETYSWSAIFMLNLPLGAAGIAAILAGYSAIPARRRPVRFDGVGITLFGIAMACLVYVLQEGSRYDWFAEPHIVELSCAGAAALLLFLVWQVRKQGRGALIDFNVLRNEHFTFGFIVSFVAGFALFGSAFAIPAFALQVLSLTPTHAGLLLLPSGMMVGIALLIAGALIQLKGVAPFKLIPIGILCFMTAMWLLSGSTSNSGAVDMSPPLLLRGFGLGFLFVALTMVALVDLKEPLAPHGVALFNFGRQFGGLIGIAFLLTYLEDQIAHNRNLLGTSLVPGNPAMTEWQTRGAHALAGSGFDRADAMAATAALLQKEVQTQVAVISFNELFLAIALLFLVAAPALIVTKLILAKTLRRVPHH